MEVAATGPGVSGTGRAIWAEVVVGGRVGAEEFELRLGEIVLNFDLGQDLANLNRPEPAGSAFEASPDFVAAVPFWRERNR